MSAFAVYLNERGEYEAGADGRTKVRVCGTATISGAETIASMWNEDRRKAAERRCTPFSRRLSLVDAEGA